LSYAESNESKVTVTKKGKDYVFTVKTLDRHGTAYFLGILPRDVEGFNELDFITENYVGLVDKIVYPSIVEPEIPIDKVDFYLVQNLLNPILEISGLSLAGEQEDAAEEFQP